ncbi:MAG: HD domain-containing protein [Oscillospiraceae bacterium]|nr:HD domain-containing protein [Oscillospiraceae bacterium]
MRQRYQTTGMSGYRLMIVDDDEGLIDSLSTLLKRNGYDVEGFSNPLDGLEELRQDSYDLLILDYFMSPIRGDDFVSELRQFDTDLYVILLTGHKDLAPPFATIKAFDIQAYCEKSHRLDQLQLLIESGIKSINQKRRIKTYRDGLQDILDTLSQINRLQPFEDMVNDIVENMISLADSEDIFMQLEHFGHHEGTVFKGSGRFNLPMEQVMSTIGEQAIADIDKVKVTKQPVSTDDSYILPIVSNATEGLEGIVYIGSRVEENNLLDVFVTQASSLLQNVMLHEQLNSTLSDLKASYVETIEALRLAVDAKDVSTRGHSDRVALYAQLLATKLGLSKEEIEDLRIGGLFHDIGKIGISDDILLKTSKLSDTEFYEVMKHPTKGAVILSAISAFEDIKGMVNCHHERYDGSGYPYGLKGVDIPLGARIISVADAYDAMISPRAYRDKRTPGEAIDELKKGCDSQFDRRIVECFLSALEEDADQMLRISSI